MRYLVRIYRDRYLDIVKEFNSLKEAQGFVKEYKSYSIWKLIKENEDEK